MDFIAYDKSDEAIQKLFESLLASYQVGSKTSLREDDLTVVLEMSQNKY